MGRLQLRPEARNSSVCEITSASGSASCGQNTAATGYLTRCTHDLLGNITGVTQNAQAAAGSQQTRSYSYDGLSRLTSETNPEAPTEHPRRSACIQSGRWSQNRTELV